MGPFSKIATVNENEFTDAELENNRTYYYKVKTFTRAGRESPDSAVIAAQTAPSPFSPIILDATPLIGGVKIHGRQIPNKVKMVQK